MARNIFSSPEQLLELLDVDGAAPVGVEHADHHLAGVLAELAHVAVDERLLELQGADLAAAVPVHGGEPGPHLVLAPGPRLARPSSTLPRVSSVAAVHACCSLPPLYIYNVTRDSAAETAWPVCYHQDISLFLISSSHLTETVRHSLSVSITLHIYYLTPGLSNTSPEPSYPPSPLALAPLGVVLGVVAVGALGAPAPVQLSIWWCIALSSGM